MQEPGRRGERELETRLRQAPRVEGQQDEERGRETVPHAALAAEEARGEKQAAHDGGPQHGRLTADDGGERDERRERQAGGEGRGEAREPEQEKGRARDQRDVEAGDGEHVVDARAAEVRQQGGRELTALADEETLEERARHGRQVGLDDGMDPEPGPEPPGQGGGRQALHARRARGCEVARGAWPGSSRLGAGIPERLQCPHLAGDADVVARPEGWGRPVERQGERAGRRPPGLGAGSSEYEGESHPRPLDLRGAAHEPLEHDGTGNDPAYRRERVGERDPRPSRQEAEHDDPRAGAGQRAPAPGHEEEDGAGQTGGREPEGRLHREA